MSAMIPFSFDGAEVRVADQAGDPWFVAADICSALGISNPSDAVGKLDADEKGVALTDTPGGRQEMIVVNESGMYTLILRCRDAVKEGSTPHRFRRWVTSEVIPTIRKTGSYGRDPVELLNDPQAMRGLLLTYSEKVLALEAQNAELAPKAEALDRIATADGSLCITDAAKTLQVRPKDLFSFLRSHGWIYSRPGTSDVAYQPKLASGLLEHKTTTIYRSDGSEKVTTQVRVTPKGLTRLAKLFPPTLRAA